MALMLPQRPGANRELLRVELRGCCRLPVKLRFTRPGFWIVPHSDSGAAAGSAPWRLAAPLPGDGPIGEAWVLSDRDDHPSLVANGALKGRSIGQLMDQCPEQLMGRLAGRCWRSGTLH